MFTPFNPRYKICWFYVVLAAICLLAIVASTEMGLTENFGEFAMNVDMVMLIGCFSGLCVEWLFDNKRPRQWTEDDM